MNYEDTGKNTFLAAKKKLLPHLFSVGFVLRFEVIALEILSQGREGGSNNCLVRLSEEQNESSFL